MHSRFASRPIAVQLRIIAFSFVAFCCASSLGAQQAPRQLQQLALQIQQSDTGRARPKAIEHTDAYYTRLTIHRYLSYAELPLFGAEYYLGNKLYNAGTEEGSTKGLHQAVAIGLEGLFAANTFTGVWNLYEARNDPNRAKRYLHALLMLSADAGFAYTGFVSAHDARFRYTVDQNGDLTHAGTGAYKHRKAAIISMSAATVGTLIMWFVPNKD